MFVTAIEEIDGFEFFTNYCFFFVGNILERSTVDTQIKPQELHDAFSANDISTVFGYHVDYILRVILQFTGFLNISFIIFIIISNDRVAYIRFDVSKEDVQATLFMFFSRRNYISNSF